MTTELTMTYGIKPADIIHVDLEMRALASVYSLLLRKAREKQEKMTLEANSEKANSVSVESADVS